MDVIAQVPQRKMKKFHYKLVKNQMWQLNLMKVFMKYVKLKKIQVDLIIEFQGT
jgi:hypothetical protein